MMESMGQQHVSSDPHMRLTSTRSATRDDSARFEMLLATIRNDLTRYRDVAVARDDGFVQFLPNVPLPIHHFTKWTWGAEASFRFDPRKPTSLLYRKEPTNSFTLVGVMYTAPQGASENELHRRVPLGLAQWHQHVNWCIPRANERSRWTETRNARPLFGPQGTVSTEAGCDAVGGRFLPRLFGWMVHIDAFADAHSQHASKPGS